MVTLVGTCLYICKKELISWNILLNHSGPHCSPALKPRSPEAPEMCQNSQSTRSDGNRSAISFFLLLFFFKFFKIKKNFFFLLYNIVLVLPYIDMNPPWVYMCSPSWTPLPPPSPSHPSGSFQFTSPEHPVSCIEPGLAICFRYNNFIVNLHLIFLVQ